ncbi:MAG: AAA family ATPase [Thermodesulfobacteriota bacterium]
MAGSQMIHCTSFFNLKENPFVLTPDPKYLYLGHKHREVLSHLLYGITDEKGFMVVIGEVGTGKTTLCRAFIEQLLKQNVEVGLIYNPAMTDLELLQAINREFKIGANAETKGKLIDTLNEFLLRVHGEGRKVVLIVDEAQNLEPTVMEQLRLISNLETETGKLIHIILVGQPELERILARKEMRQLDQRVVVRGLLGPLKSRETREYIQHRLNVASALGEDGVSFSSGASSAIHSLSGGIPRLINVLADRALLVAYAQGKKKIERSTVRSAYRDLERSRYKPPPAYASVRWQTAVVFFVFALAAVGWFYQEPLSRIWKKPEAATVAVQRTVVSSPVKVPGPETRKPPEAKPEDWVSRILKPMEGLSRDETWRLALESAFSVWREGTTIPHWLTAGNLPRDTRLRLWEISGNMTRLCGFNYPSILELRRSGRDSVLYVLLRKVNNERAVVTAQDDVSLPVRALNDLWYGHAFVLWKDFEDFPRVISSGAPSLAVTWLQHNLKSLRLLDGPVSGIYDALTKEAVMRLQRQKSLAVDGVVGPETMMVLYSLLGVYPKPTLLGEDEERTSGP